MGEALVRATQLLRIVTAQGISMYGNQLVAFVIPWIILAKTGSAASAGFVAFAMGIAAFAGIFLGGFVTDRIGGRVTSIIADSLSFVTAAFLAIALLFDGFSIWVVLITQVIGVFFDGPGQIAKNTLVPPTARRENVSLIRAMGLTHTIQNTAMFVGPLSAGVLIGLLSESFTLFLASFFFLLSVLFVTRVKVPRQTNARRLSPKQAVQDIKDAINFLRREPFLGPMQLFGPIFAFMMPIGILVFTAWFSLDGKTSASLGLFLGLQALGGIIGGIAYTAFGPKFSQRTWLIVSTITYACLLAALSFVRPGSVTSLVLGFTNGLAFTGIVTIPYAAFYARAPQTLLGRLNSIGAALAAVVGAILALLFGWFIDATSGAAALLVCAIGMGIIAVCTLFFPFMKLLDETHAPIGKINNPGGG